MSEVSTRVDEARLRWLDRWAMAAVTAMGLGPLVPYALSVA